MTHHVMLLLCFGLAARPARAAITEGGLRPLAVVTELPGSSLDVLRYSFRRGTVPAWAGIVASTAILYQYDADLYDGAMKTGRGWGLSSEDKTKTVLGLGDIPIVRLPSDAGSALYFLGDGWTHFSIAGAFAATGYFGAHARAWNTGLRIVHGIVVSTLFNQVLKRTTGRESPNHRTSKRGTWRPFPNQVTYGHNTPKYDAFPSGHVMTATLVFTTIRMNYPEHGRWLWPVQALWTSALMFQMMNNGVHWASDYPLGIMMGWAVAQVTGQFGAPRAGARATAWNQWSLYPSVDEFGTTQINAARSF